MSTERRLSKERYQVFMQQSFTAASNSKRLYRPARVLRQGFFGRRGAGAFAAPFMMFAEAGEMFFDLGGEFGESGFANGGQMFAFVGCVKRAGREREIQCEAEFLGPRDQGKNAMKLN